jgi:hypothetical protein
MRGFFLESNCFEIKRDFDVQRKRIGAKFILILTANNEN